LLAAVELAAIVIGVTWDGPNPTGVVILLFPYALFRWGSGREATIGLAFVLFPVVLGAASAPVGEVLGGGLILLFAAALGAAFRYRSSARLGGRSRPSSASASSWRASCTTLSLTMCRPSPSRLRPAGPSPRLVLRLCSTPSPSSRRKRRAH
jgi:hypothetical protein